MNSGKHIVSNKTVLIAIGLIQFLFSINAYFVAIDSSDCPAMKKEIKKHCNCCKSCEVKSVADKCTTADLSVYSGEKLSKCQCIFKTNSQSEYTAANHFELQKVYVDNVVNYSLSLNYSDLVYSKVSNTLNENGPPIYLTDSTLLI